MKTLNERATEILQALLAVRAYRIDHGNGVYTRLRAAMIGRNGKVQPYFAGRILRS